jgi:diguanylate cyclase (GGDEF)-like protein
VVGLFVLSALVPLGLCALFLSREFKAELTHAQDRNLDDITRGYGMTLLGRLDSADDVLEIITMEPASDQVIQERLARLAWVRSTRRVESDGALVQDGQRYPLANAVQLNALRAGKSVLLRDRDEHGNTAVYLVRTLPSGAWLYTELNPEWLWAEAAEYAGSAALQVLDQQGATLAHFGATPPAGTHFDGWVSRSWELFLASRYSSPSWRLVALSERSTLISTTGGAYWYLLAFIALTILLIAWLSIASIRRQMLPLELLTRATQRVAQRDFEAFRGLSWDDEFGELARSFDTMSDKLKAQFDALETLAEVDRQLLGTPNLELILHALLPRIAELMHCDSVAVLLFDADSNERARAYDYFPGQPAPLPVRRVAADIGALRTACARQTLPMTDACAGAFVPPNASRAIAVVRLHAIKHRDDCVGVLCIGHVRDPRTRADSGVAAGDFADRLSLIFANVKQSERLRHQANFDSLTGLQNRHLFADSVRAAVLAAESSNRTGALLYIDLDHFKRVNDTAGHAIGDVFLRIVAERLTGCVAEGSAIARLGGDEFAVLLPSVAEPEMARQMAERIIASLQPPVAIDGREHQVSASIGITLFPTDGTLLEELLKAGDIAMYHAKERGRGRAVFFQGEMQQRLIERVELESDLNRAFQRGDFKLHYQPIVSETPPGTLAVEALLRWPSETEEPWVSPAVFIPITEESGLIVELGHWVLRTACRQFAQWRTTGPQLDYMSVNVSARQLREPGYLDTLLSALRDNGMQGRELQVEITESVLVHGAELEHTLASIAALGVRLALDDFGTGYSSLSYLRTYPIQTVKIDRSFVLGLPQDEAACRLAESIVVMCGALGKNVVAEGVETEAQRQFLRRAGCTTIQGYLLGRPMEPADIPGFARQLRGTLGAPVDESGAAVPPVTMSA